jgi:hypothetical protein
LYWRVASCILRLDKGDTNGLPISRNRRTKKITNLVGTRTSTASEQQTPPDEITSKRTGQKDKERIREEEQLMNDHEIVQALVENIEELSPDYMDTAIAGMVTITVELYTIKQAELAVRGDDEEGTQ